MNSSSLEIILDTMSLHKPTFLCHRQVGVTAGFTWTNHLVEQRTLEVHRLQREEEVLTGTWAIIPHKKLFKSQNVSVPVRSL